MKEKLSNFLLSSIPIVCLILVPVENSYSKVPATSEVVIVGAGLSGMSAGYYLKKAGIPFHILEIKSKVGGRVQTVEYKRNGESGIFTDSGMEEYWESNPAVNLLRELKLPISGDVAVSSIVLNDKLNALGDEEPAEFRARIFTKAEQKALKDFDSKISPLVHELHSRKKPIRKELFKLKDISFKKYVQDFKLPKKVEEWVRVSLECEIGTHWDRISAMDGLAEFHIFVGEGEKCYRVEGGNAKFTDGLAKAIGLQNISTGKRVTRVATKGNRVRVSYRDMKTNENGVIEASHVVSTVPLYRVLMEVQFEPSFSKKKVEAIKTMTWGAYFKAHIFTTKKAEHYWTRKGLSILPILSDSNLGVIYEGNPDYKGKTKILSLLVHGDSADRYNLMPLDRVRGEIFAGLEKLWPGFTKHIDDIEFYRYHPRAIAAWPVGRSRFDDLSEEIRRPENRVYLAGDFTESSHSDGAFISAERVVRQIKAARLKDMAKTLPKKETSKEAQAH